MPINTSKNTTTAWQLSNILSEMQSCLNTIQKDEDKCQILIQKMVPYVDRMKRLQQQRKLLNKQVKQMQQRLDNQGINKQKQDNRMIGKANQKKKINQITANLKKQNLINLQKITSAKQKLKFYLIKKQKLEEQILQKKLSNYKQMIKSHEDQIQGLIKNQQSQHFQGIWFNISKKHLNNEIKTNNIQEYFQSQIQSLCADLGQTYVKFETLKDKKRKEMIKNQLRQIFENMKNHHHLISSDQLYKQYQLSKCQLLSQGNQLTEQIDRCKQKIRLQLFYCVQKIQKSIFQTKRIKFQNKNMDQGQLSLILKQKQIDFRWYLEHYNGLKLNIIVFVKYLKQKVKTLDWKYYKFHQTYQKYQQLQIITKIQNIKSLSMDAIQKLQHLFNQIEPVERFQFLHVSELVFF